MPGFSLPQKALAGLAILTLACGSSCDPRSQEGPREPQPTTPAGSAGAAGGGDRAPEVVDSRPPPMARPVPLWDNGSTARQIDAATAAQNHHVLIDLGEEWTPYLFSERTGQDGEHVEHGYRDTYLALARGEFPDDHHGERARDDKYLELYGILPTLGLLRERFRATRELTCAASLDYAPLHAYTDFVAYHGNEPARGQARSFEYLDNQLRRAAARQGVEGIAQLDRTRLSERDEGRLRQWERRAPQYFAVKAAQQRLDCEGFFRGKGRWVRGALDWATHEALAEFERRHRVYGWGYIGRDTLAALRLPPMESERESVIRILTERAMHSAGIIEDGSTSTRADGTPRTFTGADGAQHPVPDLEAALRERVIAAFGLATPESTLAWLEGLGDLPPEGERMVAIPGPTLPEYYSADMELQVEIDRGDVWYDFPYDDQGRERPQGVQRRPHLTLFAQYRGQKIALARFGTTIGGWRSEWVDGREVWRYKNSPPGPRIWQKIVAAPVWLPPQSTPPRDLLSRTRRRDAPRPYVFNMHELGPSYASAYGLAVAYHVREYERDEESGQLLPAGDEGIRTHGSVDYMSIMRRHSHGCHRLHNHIAVRMMSFVLAHRPHRRLGMQRLGFRRSWDYEGETYELAVDRGGYEFELDRPLNVEVLRGRIRGSVQEPISIHIPKFNETYGAYLMPDGTAVVVRGAALVPIPMPPPPVRLGPDGQPLPPPPPPPVAPAVPAAPGAVPPATPAPAAPPAAPAAPPPSTL